VGDQLTDRYRHLLSGTYDCVDRIVLNAYFSLAHSPGGFRVWWRRWHGDSDEELDNAHLIRLAGRFSRRLRASAKAQGIPVIDCRRGERKHQIAEEYLATHRVATGVFLVLVARAPATVWDVRRTGRGCKLTKKVSYVNHYSFHIWDPTWGHVTIKMSGHPPFGAQVILNGHEYVDCGARKAGIGFAKAGNCFTAVADPQALAQVADTLSSQTAVGHLSQVCDRWIYSACLCFGLDLAEQEHSGFHYSYSVYQLEYSRNLLFRVGGQMERAFDAIVDRTRSRLDVPTLRTLFAAKHRPHTRGEVSPKLSAVIERPRYGLTLFKVHFGLLTLKAYTKGEHVLRFEAIVHNARTLRTSRALDRFPDVVARLATMVDRFCSAVDCVDVGFLPDGTLDELPLPSQLGAVRVGGIDLNKPRTRRVMAAVLALSAAPSGFTVADLATKVQSQMGPTGDGYTVRQAAYDVRKLRAKGLVVKPDGSRRYRVPPEASRTMTALTVLREHVIGPIIAGCRVPRRGRPPTTWTPLDRHYETLRRDMVALFDEVHIAHAAAAA
jgi:hypothetical protein